jgi:putative CocE/NonD family hydrolase
MRIGRTGRIVLATCLAAVALAVAPPASADPEPVVERGYLTMEDGVRLAYTVVHPPGDGPWPTLFEYSGYNAGREPDAGYIDRFVERSGHYAYVGVNLRGTGCSEGTFDFFQPQEGRDGAAVVEWITGQPWSDGRVGMIGKSYPGITQLFVAAEDPEGLEAIAPGHFFSDVYRDVARPGGIMNHGFASLWSFVARPSYEFQESPAHVAAGDAGCVNGMTSEVRGLPTNPFVQLLQHPFDDELTRERSPISRVDDLVRADIPMLATLAWQDEQLASRQTHLLAALDDAGAGNWWATLSNGDHSMSRTAAGLDDLERFYDHFVRGEDNGWADRPRVQVWWEAGRDGTRSPGWVTALDHWSEARRRAAGTLEPWPLALSGGGRLGVPPRAGAPGTAYLYAPAVGSQGVGNPAAAGVGLPDVSVWGVRPPPGTAASFTSPPLGADVTALGSGSLDLWIAAVGTDVDLQVTLTEVRPGGQEVFVQQGWLRASQRAIDTGRSTELLPVQTHAAADVVALVPGEPTPVRVELFPFGHLFRSGSRIRIWVEGPTVLPQLWAFTPTPTPVPVTILHDDAHPSRLVLPLVPNDPDRRADRPRCGTVIHQPCRPAS